MQYALHSVARASRSTRATFALTFTGAGALLPDSTRFCGVNEFFPFISFEPILPLWLLRHLPGSSDRSRSAHSRDEQGAAGVEDSGRNHYLRKRLRRPGT